MHRPTDRTVVHSNALSLRWTLDCVWQDGVCIGGVNADRVWTVRLIMLSRPISNTEVESNRRWIDEVKPARPITSHRFRVSGTLPRWVRVRALGKDIFRYFEGWALQGLVGQCRDTSRVGHFLEFGVGPYKDTLRVGKCKDFRGWGTEGILSGLGTTGITLTTPYQGEERCRKVLYNASICSNCSIRY